MTGTEPTDREGELLAGRYRIESVLGRGGMAVVYRAQDTALGRTVAIKVFHAASADGRAIERQRLEVELLATLNHPSLVTLYDTATEATAEGDRTLLVMEFVPGSDLRERIIRGPIESGTVAAIGQEIASALAYIHDRGVVHRDLKPANILLSEDDPTGRMPAKLADFGIARLVDAPAVTMTGTLVGTASYLSPEQARGAEVTSSTDIYALGLVLLECLTGERAFPGSAADSMLLRIASDPRIPGRLGPDWGSLLRAMTSREPADRPTAAEAAARLGEASAFALLEQDDDGEATAAAEPTVAGEAMPDETGGTLLLPRVETGTTTLLAPAGPPAPRVAAPGVPAPSATSPAAVPRGGRAPRRAVAIAIASIGAAAILGFGVVWAVSSTAQDPAATTSTYPAVPGPLGTHLTQLQEAVAP